MKARQKTLRARTPAASERIAAKRFTAHANRLARARLNDQISGCETQRQIAMTSEHLAGILVGEAARLRYRNLLPVEGLLGLERNCEKAPLGKISRQRAGDLWIARRQRGASAYCVEIVIRTSRDLAGVPHISDYASLRECGSIRAAKRWSERANIVRCEVSGR